MMSARHLKRPDGRSSASDTGAGNIGWEIVRSPVCDLKQIKVVDGHLTYTELGQGEPVIFVHGALGDYRTWTPQLNSLSGQYHVVAYSRRYHQPNSPINDVNDYTYRRHADDLIALIDTLQLAPFHLVGNSYGSAVALLVAMEHPDKVRSLVLADPWLFSILSSAKDLVSFRLHRIALDVVKRLADSGELRIAVREYVKIVLGKDGFDDLPLEALLVVSQNAQTLGPMLRTFLEQSDFDHYASRFVRTPTLVITGEFSPSIYRAICVELDAFLSNSTLLTLAEASYGLYIENQIGFNAALLDFLRKTSRLSNV